mmetsp:Transcript_11913/g.13726  ORF Transcript_11913/g.13726 Transcript_11913/m.13726 type:complete len:200 (-) Transcript_11913:216-815(-)
MKSWAQTLCLKNDEAGILEYKQLHRNCWPEVLKALKTVGILQLKIYLKGRRLFMYMETVDDFRPEVDFPKHMQITPAAVEWGRVTSALQETAPEAGSGEWWTFMEEVYDFQDQYLKYVGSDGPVDLGVSVETYYDRKSTSSKKPRLVTPGEITLTEISSSCLNSTLSQYPILVCVVSGCAGILIGLWGGRSFGNVAQPN